MADRLLVVATRIRLQTLFERKPQIGDLGSQRATRYSQKFAGLSLVAADVVQHFREQDAVDFAVQLVIDVRMVFR